SHGGDVELLEFLAVGHDAGFLSSSSCFYTTQGPRRRRGVWGRARVAGSSGGTGSPQRAQLERMITRPPQPAWVARAEDGSPQWRVPQAARLARTGARSRPLSV